MPRYFIDTADHVAVRDDEGTVLPDRAACGTCCAGP